MIAASEPLEFVPHGRTVLAKHPGQIYGKGHNNSISENSLLYKLTNFAIKDESLHEDKEKEEQEWWCIREVYYRKTYEIEKDSSQQKYENKYECNSDMFRPTSRLKTDFNISVKSELLSSMKKMETECGSSAGPSTGGSANSSSNMSKKFNVQSASKATTKPINPKTDCSYEEELYVKGCTAVWSKGLISSPATKLHGPEQRETICCYTIDNPIKHAAFCNFHVDINNTMLIDALNSQIGDVKKNIKVEDTTEYIDKDSMPCIILLDSSCMRAFAVDGQEYITSIPFQVKRVWPMKYGLLLEKDASPLLHNSIILPTSLKLNESQNSTFSKSKTSLFNMSAKLRAESMSSYDHEVPLPTCFSVTHPLDEVIPIIMKSQSHGLQYYNDGDVQIIFVATSPSIILLYDWKLGTHSLWKIRKAARDECLTVCPNVNSTTTLFSQSCDYICSPMRSNRNTANWTGLPSPFHSRKANTPTTPRSRLNSPMANMFHNQGLSPHGSIGQASSVSMMANTIPQTPPSLPLYPDICLEHIWTDSQVVRRDPMEKQSEMKAFLHTDLVGHDYLCFMVKVGAVGKLQILRLQKSHAHGQSSKSNLIVGAMSTVLAKDAVVLNHLKMIALIDEAGNIILQSGNHFVGKVHVGGILARLIDSPYTKRSNFQSPFPRRSSLLPTRCNETTGFDDSALHLLSPVPHTTATRSEAKETLGLSGLLDAAGSLVTLQFDEGDEMYRISLPTLSSCALVTRCHAALTAILPKDVTMQVIIKWYGVRNAPGTQDLTPEQEWLMFSNLLLTLIGYDVEKLQSNSSDDQIETSEVVSKKQRTSSDGTFDDWQYLLNSKLHKVIGNPLAAMLNLTPINIDNERRYNRKHIDIEKPAQFNHSALLFPYTLQILYAFHLLYEEIKLNVLLYNDLKPLSIFLYQISRDLKLDTYINHYWLDFPTEFNLEHDDYTSQMADHVLSKLTEPSYFSKDPPHVFGYLNSVLKGIHVGYYPYLADINNTSRDIIEVLTIIGCGRSAGIQTISRREGVGASSTPRTRRDCAQHSEPYCQAVMLLVERGMNPRDLEQLPPGVALVMLGVLARVKADPPPDWPPEAYRLLARNDLALQKEIAHTIKNSNNYMETLALEVLEKETAYSLESNRMEDPAITKLEDPDASTGMEHLNTKLLRLLYPRDQRITEVCNLLQSSKPALITLMQRPDVSDHDFIEEQEKFLFALSTRTMALPIARGMATLRSAAWCSGEGVRAPRVCLWGRAPPPRSAPLSPPAADLAPQALLWPNFHNGVAAGLALVPLTAPTIDTTWLIYNKPRGTTELSTEHAGFLMALGLNGHLRDMPYMNLYEYLVKCHEMISIGLLLGLAATYRGTMDVQATKMMSIHLEPLLPPTSIELDLHQNIVVAALLGVGLIYQGTAHTHYSQVLLNEIGKVPGPDMENCVERDGYALAAGLALGMVCVGAGNSAERLPPSLARTLRTLMLGGDNRPLTGSLKDRQRVTSGATGAGSGVGGTGLGSGSCVHVDVSGPGATVALGLVYLRTGSAAPAAWLQPPATPYHMDFVRPDLLMLRVISRGLILWDSIEASEEWIEEQVPDTIKPYCFVKPTEDNIDYEAMNQAYCNIVAGACFALGLRFAGSGSEDARDAVLQYARLLVSLSGKALGELAGRSTLESCMCVCLLSAGMIMAGRGDIEVLRICRRLRARVPTPPVSATIPPLTHGAQMSVHCTVGLLFLGGGRATLSTSPAAVAALLAAFFPKFPTHSEDNRYHLQAFRHLYVLAVEPRLILPRDLDTGKLCYTHIQLIDLEGAVTEMKAPCILPELEKLREVKINDPRYWPITFQRGRNWDQLEIFLKYTWCVDVKQRAGCLSYLDDPRGFLTILSQSLTLDKANVWYPTPENIELFTSDERVQNFIKRYLAKEAEMSVCADCLLVRKKRKAIKNEQLVQRQCLCRRYSMEEQEHVQALSMVTFECVVRDILCALPVWTSFLKILKTLKSNPSTYHIWQIKILLSQIENQNKRSQNDMTVDGEDAQNEPLVSGEFTLSMKQRISNIFDGWELKLTAYLRKYLGLPSSRKFNVCDDSLKRILTTFLVYHDLPRGVLKDFLMEDFPGVIGAEGNLSVEALSKIDSLVR